MDELRKYILQPIINVFKFHKFKVFFLFLCTLLFAVLMFPFNEIADIVSAQISKATRNQVQVSFDDLGLSFYPFGISAKDVYILTPRASAPLFIEQAYISPSLLSLLSLKPGGTLTAKNIFGGDIHASLTNLGRGGAQNKDSKLIGLQLNFNSVDFDEVMSWLKSPAKLSGDLSGKVDLRFDMMAYEQPRGEFNINGQNVRLPGSISMQGMDMMLPEGVLKKLVLAGKIQNGDLSLTQGQLGQPNDVIYGKVKGKMALNTRRAGAGIMLVPGAYDFSFDLNFSEDAESKLGTMLGTVLLNNKGGRSETLNGGARYIFSVSGFPNGVPKFLPLNQFD